jgi:putative transposase
MLAGCVRRRGRRLKPRQGRHGRGGRRLKPRQGRHEVRLRGLGTGQLGDDTVQRHIQLYVHLNWATWDRLPLLSAELRSAVYACIQTECGALGAEVLAIGGTEDDVHLLVRLPTTVSVATLVKQFKGASSHLVTHELIHENGFRWQGTYGAFSVSRSDVPRICDYIARQEEHHRDQTLDHDLEFDAQHFAETS